MNRKTVTFFLAKRFYRCLGKVEHILKQWREPSELPSPGQLISNEWIREAETSDCRNQSIVIAIRQLHAARDSSLSKTTMNKQEQRLGRREIQVKEKHSHMNWRNQGEKIMDKQDLWRKEHQARLRWVEDTSIWRWRIRLEKTLRTDKQNKWEQKKKKERASWLLFSSLESENQLQKLNSKYITC